MLRSSVARDRLVLITGTAGIGKTWLCEKAASILEAKGAMVLSGGRGDALATRWRLACPRRH